MEYSSIISTPIIIYFVFWFSMTYSRGVQDYWSADFDAYKECKLVKRIEELSRLEPSPCETVKITEGEEKAFYDCKIKLSNNLQGFCDVRDHDIWQLLFYFKMVPLGPKLNT